jgi:hypothetical protein
MAANVLVLHRCKAGLRTDPLLTLTFLNACVGEKWLTSEAAIEKLTNNR